jgi:hypothetical protein
MSASHPRPPGGPRFLFWILAFFLVVAIANQAIGIYMEDLWHSSTGYQSVYWTRLMFQFAAFAVFAVATAVVLAALFRLILPGAGTLRTTLTVGGETIVIPGALVVRRIGTVAVLVLSILIGLAYSIDWTRFALFLNQPPPTGDTDPIFGQDLNFYMFVLPTLESLAGWLMSIGIITLLAAAISTALERANRWRSLSLALSLVLVALAFQSELSRFRLMFNDNDLFTGVSYVHANAVIPGLRVLVLALILGSFLCAYNVVAGRSRNLAIAVGLPAAVFAAGQVLIPAYVTSFIVRPNELARELPYIGNNIEHTLAAFKLDEVEQIAFDPIPFEQGIDIDAHSQTLENIRLWDWRALQSTLEQVQEIRTYYDFSDVDVDRYVIGGEKRSVMLATRELNLDRLPSGASNWINERLIFTHGYGVTMNSVNGFTQDGLPELILSDMPVQSTSESISVVRPEVYFGETTDWHVYVNTLQEEFNYPEGDANNYSTYAGGGGIRVGGFFRRLLIAYWTGELGTLPFAADVTSDSLLLTRRSIGERVRALAPFLLYDDDAYIVVGDDGGLYWIVDAFTVSDRHPYSRPVNVGNRRINYIRNSVKVVVNAYDGTTRFYVYEPDDVLIRAYRNIFPDLFLDREEMPDMLDLHTRYPEFMFQIQALVYSTYHVEDAQVFYNREDLWTVAQQGRSQAGTNIIEPYFVLLRFPGEEEVEFVSILPFTPTNRNNLIGWLAARSDGDAYGSLRAYAFPKTGFVDGPLQVEARIDQNPDLSSQLSLWNQQGSTVLRGNLLVIPLDETLLFVSPIFLQAERSPMPELRLVVLATENRLTFAPTFDEALRNLIVGGSSVGAGIPEVSEDSQPEPGGPEAPVTEGIAGAHQALEDYLRLTAEGRLAEAGGRLEELREILNVLYSEP